MSEAQDIIHAENAILIPDEFCSDHGSQRKSLPVVCSVYDGNIIYCAAILNLVCTWRGILSFADDGKFR